MGSDRRTFLQQLGLSLMMLGGGMGGISPSALDAYGRTLASSTPRKLALLVGINQYGNGRNLKGCLTDVELQRELLICRFGFNPSDILTLTEGEATRDKIVNAFEEHLVRQAASNDIVVFHFSGYGRMVQLSSPAAAESAHLAPSLMPSESPLLNKNPEVARDLLLDNLIALGRSLPTDKLTVVLDTSYQPATSELDSQVGVRSYRGGELLAISPEELLFTRQLQDGRKNAAKSPSMPGLILSASKNDAATEIASNDFNAGLFTYSLTQYFWESIASTSAHLAMEDIASRVALYTGGRQKPSLEGEKRQSVLPYYLNPEPQLAGQAIITQVNEDNTVELELVGFPIWVLANYQINSYFESLLTEKDSKKIHINFLQGNRARGIVIEPGNELEPGMICQELWRVLPRNLGLTVALDTHLERIERVDATSTLSTVNEVASVINLGEDFADCILGKIEAQAPSGGYGLFSPAGALLPNTQGKNLNEAVSSAVKRLRPQLQTLLAAKILNLTFNYNYSGLPVSATLEIKGIQSNQFKSQKNFSSRGAVLNQTQKHLFLNESKPNNPSELLMNIPVGSQFNLKVSNESEGDIYLLLFGFNSSGKAIAYYSPEVCLIEPGAMKIIPEDGSALKWIVNAARGLGQLILVCAPFAFAETLAQLDDSTAFKGDREQIIQLDDSVLIGKALLQDLHRGSQVSSSLMGNVSDVYALNLNKWASFSFVYQIV